MPLDDALFAGIADAIAVTEREFRDALIKRDEDIDKLGKMLEQVDGCRLDAAKALAGDLAALDNTISEAIERLGAEAKAAGEDGLTKLAELTERFATVANNFHAHVDLALVWHEKADGRIEELAADLAAADERIASRLSDEFREQRLDLDQQLFGARKRYDQLCGDLAVRLVSLKDGEPGSPGRDGEPGLPGEPGRDGIDGITGEARGKYDPAEDYRKLDRVSFNRSEWIARKDDPGPLPGDGWMMGAQGGPKGRPGNGILGGSVKDYAFVMEMDNGKTIRFDLRSMFERYHEERGE